ncbi:MAG: LamG domain-containing protein [Kiritimatiellae bacterium]|nr:LamG domain-containing protein [Kiritimatiellia bacterium]
MSKMFLRLGALLVAGFVLSTARADLVAHYTFDNSGDLGANSGSASIPWGNFSNVTQTTGLFGAGAGSFVAGTSEAWTPNFGAANANLNNFSLSMHVKQFNATNWRDYISIGTGNDVVFVFEDNGTGVSLYNIGNVGGSTAPDLGNLEYSATQIDDGEWHHLGLVVTGGNTTLYVDGASQGSATYNGSGTISAFQLASRFGDGVRAITAELDDVGVWNEALTADQMAYFSANAIPEPATFSIVLATLGAALIRRRRIG